MKSIRIGNDIDIHWGIFTGDGLNEVPYDMTGKDISLYAQTRATDIFEVVEFTIDKHVIKWRFKGKEQRTLGVYKITLVENKGKDDMHTIDECKAFQLVDDSCKATCDCGSDDNFRVTTLEFRSKMSVGYPSGGGDSTPIAIDAELSETSENPVQNKVITNAINELNSSMQELSAKVDSNDSKISDIDELVKQLGTSVENLQNLINQIQSDNSTDGIDSLNEIKSFLNGMQDTDVLSDKLKEAGAMDEATVQQIASDVVEEAIKDIDGEITPTYDETSGKLTLS